MAQRSIGQERFGFAGRERAGSPLDALVSLIGWNPVAVLLNPLYPAAKGKPAWPPRAMFKAQLLSISYDLSDAKLAEALDDRASFRRFCSFSANDTTPSVPLSYYSARCSIAIAAAIGVDLIIALLICVDLPGGVAMGIRIGAWWRWR